MNETPFKIDVTAMFPNVFEPRPGEVRNDREHRPTYSVRFDAYEATYHREGERELILGAYHRYLPAITVTAHRAPILSPASEPSSWDMFVQGQEIARARRLFMDGLLIDQPVTLTVSWFLAKDPHRGDRWVLSLRGVSYDEYDFWNRATE